MDIQYISYIIKHSPYFDRENFIKILKEKNENFTVLSLNIQSINAKFDQIKILLHLMQENNSHISAICLQETWLRDDSNNALISLENYNFISQGKKCFSHGGLTIYLHEKYNLKTVPSPIISEIFEGQFIEISEVDTNRPTHILLGNIYRPPRDTVIAILMPIKGLEMIMVVMDSVLNVSGMRQEYCMQCDNEAISNCY